MRTEVLLDTRHCRKCAFTDYVMFTAYVDPNMEIIFLFNNLRFSPDMFYHISVIRNIFKWVAGQTESQSSNLFTADAETILV